VDGQLLAAVEGRQAGGDIASLRRTPKGRSEGGDGVEGLDGRIQKLLLQGVEILGTCAHY
jgi:hypothetical protein